MKQTWQKLALKIDALSLRERVIIFAAVAFAIVMLANSFILEPQFNRQKTLSVQIKQDQAKITEMRNELVRLSQAQAVDPNVADRMRLAQLRHQQAQLNASLLNMQKGLVPPEKMAALLEDILRRNRSLRLLSLKTLPASSIVDAAKPDEPQTAQNQNAAAASSSQTATAILPAPDLVYRHGVELTVQGSYQDMLRYMAQLEAMSTQVFWGRAELQVDEYPQATLVLTLYTLSLDKKWLNL